MEHFRHIVETFLQMEMAEDPETAQVLQNMFTLIKDQKEIRFFVDGTHHFGHQAASVNLMKRLIDRTDYAGRIRIVFAENPGLPPNSTAYKLAVLLTGLDPRWIDTAVLNYGSCRHISFLRYGDLDRLVDEVPLGFTGGADDMAINFARELKVTYFLRLQPYLWDDEASKKADPYYASSRLETSKGQSFYMTDAHSSFRTLPVTFPRSLCADVSEQTWNWYSTIQDFDPDLQISTRNARAVYRAWEANSLLALWPLYGLHQFRDQVAEMAMNIVFVAFGAQHTLGRPIVACCFNRPTAIPHFEALLTPFAGDLVSGNIQLGAFRAALKREYCRVHGGEDQLSAERLDQFVGETARHARPWIERGSRVTCLSGYDSKCGMVDISSAIERAMSGASPHDIIIVLLGPVPADVYNAFYVRSALPGLFEGQATSSLMVSLGKAFLQVSREDSEINDNYPAIVGRSNYSGLAAACRETAFQLRNQRCLSYLQGDYAANPRDYFCRLSQISEFLINTQSPTSQVASYFTALGSYYRQDIHDKLVLGLLALLTSPFVDERDPSRSDT
jgi:hypothetical protein